MWKCALFPLIPRTKNASCRRRKKIKEMQEGEVPKFKAFPVPHFETINLPEKNIKNVTQAEPFSLETGKRGAYKAEIWKHQLEEEQKQQKEAACFKARPNTAIFQEPFAPKKEKKKSVSENPSGSLLQEPFQLVTEKRVKEQQELEKKMAEMEAWKLQQLEEVRQQEEKQQKEELARLWKELVHKAKPVSKHSAVEVKCSDLPLTVPVSPKFSTAFQEKLHLHHRHGDHIFRLTHPVWKHTDNCGYQVFSRSFYTET